MRAARLRRRPLLLALLAAGAAACARPSPRPPSPEPVGDRLAVDAWDAEARTLLITVLGALRTLDSYAAYRISSAPRSSLRSTREPEWDPPTSAEWRAANDVAGRIKERSAQLHGAVASSTLDPALWRERRRLAEATRSLADMADAMVQYHEAVERLDPESDGGSTLPLLRRAWDRWEASAVYWEVSRAEALSCA